jgi:protein associated with RNAse G/E
MTIVWAKAQPSYYTRYLKMGKTIGKEKKGRNHLREVRRTVLAYVQKDNLKIVRNSKDKVHYRIGSPRFPLRWIEIIYYKSSQYINIYSTLNEDGGYGYLKIPEQGVMTIIKGVLMDFKLEGRVRRDWINE